MVAAATATESECHVSSERDLCTVRSTAVGDGEKGDVQRKQRGSEGAMDENAFVTCVSVCLCAAVATAAPSDPLPYVLYKAQMNLGELNMLKVTTTSSIEATVSPETKFNVQLKQTSLADEFTCVGNSCEKK